MLTLGSAPSFFLFLGGCFLCTTPHREELRNIIACGWCSFFKHQDALCNRRLSLSDRLRLFKSTVVPSILYGCGAWTLTINAARSLVCTRRKMLRWMVQTARLPDECWVEYIKRATCIAESLASEHGCADWVLLQRERQWILAGKVASATDRRWSHRILSWKPWFRTLTCRPAGRPRKRWDDCIARFAGGNWVQSACENSLWQALSHGFVHFKHDS